MRQPEAPRPPPWPKDLRDRMRKVLNAAEVRHRDRNVAVQELHGVWSVRSLNERRRKEPYWTGYSLEAAEEEYLR
jgi:hypothetical protein